MITEAIRIVADWLSHGTHGVSALLAGVPRDTGITQPADITVYDATRNDIVARGDVPPLGSKGGLLVTTNIDPIRAEGPVNRPFPADRRVDVVVRIAVPLRSSAAALNAASVYLRALDKCIGRLMTTADGEAARTRASVQLVGMDDISVTDVFQSLDTDAVVTNHIVIGCRMRDLHAIT